MRLDTVVPANCGDELTIAIDDYQTKAVVRWASDDAMGIAFSKEISPSLVDHMRFTRDRSPNRALPEASNWAF